MNYNKFETIYRESRQYVLGIATGTSLHDQSKYDRRQSGYERLVYQSFKQSVQQAFHIDVDRNAWVFDQNQLKTRSDGKESLKCLCETFYLNTESLFLTGQL